MKSIPLALQTKPVDSNSRPGKVAIQADHTSIDNTVQYKQTKHDDNTNRQHMQTIQVDKTSRQ